MNLKETSHSIRIYLSVGLVYLVGLFFQIIFGDPIDKYRPCAWDSEHYCLMFYGLGDQASEPFRRRIFPPYAASLISDDPVEGFLILNIASIFIVGLISTYLIKKNSDQVFLRNKNIVFIIAISFSLVVVFSRNTFRLFVNHPIRTDIVAIAAIFILFLGIQQYYRRRLLFKSFGGFLVLLSVPFAIFSREANGPATVLAALITFLFFERDKIFLFLIFYGGTITSLILFTSEADSSLKIILFWIDNFTEDFESITKFIGMTFLSIGVWPIHIYLTNKAALIKPFKTFAIFFAIAFFMVSIFGGGNVDRILMPVGLILAFISALNVNSVEQVLSYVIVSLGFFVSNYPFYLVTPGVESFLGFLDFWHSASYSEFINFGLGGILTGLPIQLLGLYLALKFSQGFRIKFVEQIED